MKILNNLNITSLISKIKYPFIKIASLFQRVTLNNRIQIVENPKYFSTGEIYQSLKSSKLSKTESFASDITIHEEISYYQDQYDYKKSSASDNENTHVKEFQDLETFSKETAKTPERKNSQPHPFLKGLREVGIDPPFVPPKNKALRQEALQRDDYFLRFPRASKEMRLTILKGFELFI